MTTTSVSANELTKRILVAISETYQPRCFVFRVNVTVARTIHRTVRSAPNGTADLIGVICGRPVAIEVKAARDRQSPAQILFQNQWRKAGGIYLIARDAEKAMDELADLLRYSDVEE